MTKKIFGVGIVGCGLIGEKRAQSLPKNCKLIACADIDITRAKNISNKFNALALENWMDLISIKDIDIVIVSTLHDSLAKITLASVKMGKHVLVEKPAARFPEELEEIINELKNSPSKVRVGFNHRYHPSLIKAKEIVDSGQLGDLMFIRGRYGHGARLNYHKEWRANPKISGGGELIDQGPHLIDLSRFFLGEFVEVNGFANTFFWDMPVDDNAFLILKTKTKKTAFLHVSCTEWKNLFSMEIYGKKGKIDINGLGGSYGVEKITYYKMLPQMGPPETSSWEFPMADNSWKLEFAEFIEDIELNRTPSANIADAYNALKIIKKIYEMSDYDYSA
jgi:predicted dehydrogenase